MNVIFKPYWIFATYPLEHQPHNWKYGNCLKDTRRVYE